MLVLSRKVGESICIGEDVVISVVKVSGNRVRLGISAPRNVDVLRSELPQWSAADHEERRPLEFDIALDCCI